ncbi:sphingomyelin phosphodiesterase [Moritella sp. 36]|uniref:sphingomyelin phosphodiesterase n=1 Tax=Moritella sp. 36 TaxID=2746233 RepID=UPI001BAD3626|nr:sphingomyelin phosphodiesterase [Moritella sp. 36]QUM89086.1 sphingomyelin phosphodiesterase [Moritella sp. 36]
MNIKHLILAAPILTSSMINAEEYTAPPKIMSYNVYMLSSTLFHTSQTKRAELLTQSNIFDITDIVSFNEAFDNESSQIISDGLKERFPYYTPVLGRQINGWDNTDGNWSPSTPEDGGVFMMSRYPIIYKAQHIFSNACGADGLSQKGFVYIKIKKDNKLFHIIATHVQADDPGCSNPASIRAQQFEEITQYIAQQNIPNNEMVIIAGDLNVVKNSTEFNSMLLALNSSEPDSFAGADYSWDPTVNALAYDSYPNLKGQLLDYILVEKNHQQPQFWHNQILDVISPKVEISGTLDKYYAYEYSDHFPVTAFEYADNTTLAQSFRPSNTPYNNIKIEHVDTGSYVKADTEQWITTADMNNPLSIEFKLDTWIPKNAFCVHDDDYIQLSLTGNYSNYFWNWNLSGYYYARENNAADYLKIRRKNPQSGCIKDGDEIYMYDHSELGPDEYLLPDGHGWMISATMPFKNDGLFVIEMPEATYTDWSHELYYR